MRGGDAVCVETRNHPRLRAAVENVRAFLPTAWHITILHGPHNAAHARRELASIADVRLRALPGAATAIGRGAAGAGGSFFDKRRRGFHNPDRPQLLCVENPLDTDHDVGANSYNIQNVRDSACLYASPAVVCHCACYPPR